MQYNVKYNRVKELLLSGKVFHDCTDRPCQFVQQQKALGVPLEYITDAELGDLLPMRKRAAGGAGAVALTVKGQPPGTATVAA